MATAEDYYAHPRTEVCDLVGRHAPPSARVLDLGCASGRLGKTLKDRGIASVMDGIELSEAAAAEARTLLDRVWSADLTGFDWATVPHDYDIIIAADVLEHLADPWETLRALRSILSPRGKVIASIPNVRYWKVVADLAVRGEFRYVEAGVLDRTHLRFFTRRSIRRLFTESGYAIESLGPNPIARPLPSRAVMALAGDFAHVQFLIVAKPLAQSGEDVATASVP